MLRTDQLIGEMNHTTPSSVLFLQSGEVPESSSLWGHGELPGAWWGSSFFSFELDLILLRFHNLLRVACSSFEISVGGWALLCETRSSPLEGSLLKIFTLSLKETIFLFLQRQLKCLEDSPHLVLRVPTRPLLKPCPLETLCLPVHQGNGHAHTVSRAKMDVLVKVLGNRRNRLWCVAFVAVHSSVLITIMTSWSNCSQFCKASLKRLLVEQFPKLFHYTSRTDLDGYKGCSTHGYSLLL